MTDLTQSLLSFPCRFPLKVIGEQNEAFTSTIVAVIRGCDAMLTQEDIVSRYSVSGRYVSLTLTVNISSREQLDRIYLALTCHPMVKVAL